MGPIVSFFKGSAPSSALVVSSFKGSSSSSSSKPTLIEEETCPQHPSFSLDRINIAIAGGSGSGKSTLMNLLRGLKNGDEGAAKTGITETTMEMTPYFFPRSHMFHDKVVLWDLPGAGTKAFPHATYVRDLKLRFFDITINVYGLRWTETNDTILDGAKTVKNQCILVRTHMDTSVESETIDFGLAPREAYSKIKNDLVARIGESPYCLSNRYFWGIGPADALAIDKEEQIAFVTELSRKILEGRGMPFVNQVVNVSVRLYKRMGWAQQTRQVNRDDAVGDECIICLSGNCTHWYEACGHLIVCDECATLEKVVDGAECMVCERRGKLTRLVA